MWVVTKGEYSDYRVLAVCASRKIAKDAAKVLKSDGSSYGEARAEEMLYLDSDPEQITIYELDVELLDDGTEHARRENVRVEWEHDMLYPEYFRPVYWRWVRAPYLQGKPISGGRLEVRGTDKERVQKVYSEKRAEILAGEPLRDRREAHS